MSQFPAAARVVTNDHGAVALIEIDLALYSEDVALKAAYWLTDKYYVHVRRAEAEKLIAEVRAKDGADGTALIEACGEFCNSLIDFAVRAKIVAETKEIQQALLQRAFVELVPKAGG